MRRGFSLLEIMLVLALLVVIAGLAMIPLRTAFEGQKLRKAGDQMRTEWAKARNQAMKTGRLYVFRCKLGLDEYEVRPWYAADDALESATLSSEQEMGATAQPGVSPLQSTALESGVDTDASDTGNSRFSVFKRLPEGILFAQGLSEAENRSADVEAEMGSLVGDTGDWGQPIMFYPDGSSSTARLVLSNKREQYVTLDLRGLTGLAQVSDLQSQQELSP